MGSVYDEINRIKLAKSDIATAIQECGVDVSDDELISNYSSYISQIPDTIREQFNVLNSRSADGYVLKGENHPNKVWKTNEFGEPAWRDETLYTPFRGVSESSFGEEGLVPCPMIEDLNKVLTGNGYWSELNTSQITTLDGYSKENINQIQDLSTTNTLNQALALLELKADRWLNIDHLSLKGSGSAYIDFHFNNNSVYNVRLVCNEDYNDLKLDGNLLPYTTTGDPTGTLGETWARFESVYAHNGDFSGNIKAANFIGKLDWENVINTPKFPVLDVSTAVGSVNQGVYIDENHKVRSMGYELNASVLSGSSGALAVYGATQSIEAVGTSGRDFFPIYLNNGIPTAAGKVKEWGNVTFNTNFSGTVKVYQYGPIVVIGGSISIKSNGLASGAAVFTLPSNCPTPAHYTGITIVQPSGSTPGETDKNTVLYCTNGARQFRITTNWRAASTPSLEEFPFSICYMTSNGWVTNNM